MNDQISLICLDCKQEYIESFINSQYHKNIEIAYVDTTRDTLFDLLEYINCTQSEYITFLEENQVIDMRKLSSMSLQMDAYKEIEVLITQRNYMDIHHNIIAHPDKDYEKVFENTLFNGRDFICYCIMNEKNLYGNLTSLMLRRNSLNYLDEDYAIMKEIPFNKIALFYFLVSSRKLVITKEAFVSTILKELNIEQMKQSQEQFYLLLLKMKKQLQLEQKDIHETIGIPNTYKKFYDIKVNTLKKQNRTITFYYSDKGEYYNLEPLMREAQKRGYQTIFTTNLKQKSDIGVYCQHYCWPQNSEFSVILLHDLIQGHNRWPNIWEIERLDKFDIAIFPGKDWENRWSICASIYYSNPRLGVFALGYPKSDYVINSDLKQQAKERKNQLNMKYNTTVLYVPSWENDDKEDDFILALQSLKVNLLIKQADWQVPEYQDIVDNINNMRKYHEHKFNNVYYLEPSESIMIALEMCDIIVSDESSVMCEGLMFRKPSLAVCDWLIPDQIPSRKAEIPFVQKYISKCKKVELRERVEILLNNISKESYTLDCGEEIFNNIGNCNKDFMDMIDYYTGMRGKQCDSFLQWEVFPRLMPVCLWN